MPETNSMSLVNEHRLLIVSALLIANNKPVSLPEDKVFFTVELKPHINLSFVHEQDLCDIV